MKDHFGYLWVTNESTEVQRFLTYNIYFCLILDMSFQLCQRYRRQEAKEEMKRKPEEVEEIKHSLWVTAERSIVEFWVVRGQEFQKFIILCEWRWDQA